MFGMGTGVSSSLSSPHQACFAHSKLNNLCVSPFPSLKPWSSLRPISTFQLNALLHLHPRPIYVIVSHGSYHLWRRSLLVGGFVLRCFQHLSRPYVATQLCTWQYNWRTTLCVFVILSNMGPAPAPGCDESTSRCQTPPSMWTLGGYQPVIPGVAFIR